MQAKRRAIMKKLLTHPTVIIFIVLLSFGLLSCSNNNAELQAKIDALTAELENYKNAEAQVEKNLALMRSADESMNARDWETFSKVHSTDVYVTSPDSPVQTTLKYI